MQIYTLPRTYIWALMSITVLFFFFFIPTLLPAVGDAELLPTDPASIIGSMKLLFEDPVYNMHNGYHSRVYGWTYFALGFVFLMPVKFYIWFSGQPNEELIIFTVRLLHFLVSYAACLAFFMVAQKVLKNVVLTTMVTFLFITLPGTAKAFYIIHPEPLGTFFFLMGIYYLLDVIDFNKLEKKVSFLVMSVFFSLAALTKHPFAIMVFFTALFLAHWYVAQMSPSKTIRQKTRAIILATLVFMGVFVLAVLVVHPYAIFEFKDFLQYQSRPASHIGSGVGLWETWEKWAAIIVTKPVALIGLLLLLPAAFYIKKVSTIFFYSVVFSAISFLIFISFQRTFISMHYIYPLYALWLINIAVVFLHVLNKLELPKEKVNYLSVFILLPCVLWASAITLPKLSDYVHNLDSSTRVEAWAYLNQYPSGTRILYEHTVALPDQFNSSSCHVWRGCSNKESVSKFAPDVVVFSPQGNYNKHEMLLGFVKQYDYELIKSFVPIEQPIEQGIMSAWINNKDVKLGGEIDVYLRPGFTKGTNKIVEINSLKVLQ